LIPNSFWDFYGEPKEEEALSLPPSLSLFLFLFLSLSLSLSFPDIYIREGENTRRSRLVVGRMKEGRIRATRALSASEANARRGHYRKRKRGGKHLPSYKSHYDLAWAASLLWNKVWVTPRPERKIMLRRDKLAV